MELRQLRYFVAIAREGSFSAASSRIGIAQPALSAQIAKLESEIGRPLLDRHRRGADLTEAGRQFLDHALDILARVDHARLSLRGRSSARVVEITLGVPPLISMHLTVPLVEEVARTLPNISLKVIEGMTGAQRQWLADGGVDLAFLHNVERRKYPHAVPVVREQLFAGARAGGPIRLGEVLHEGGLLKLPLIASTARNSHRMLLEAIGRRYRRPLTIVAEVDSIPRQHELVRRGAGVLVMPLAGFSELAGEVQLARLTGPDIRWETSLVSADTPAGAQAFKTLSQLIVRLTADVVRSGRWAGVG